MNIVFLGSGDIGLPSLKWLLDAPDLAVSMVVTQPDRAAGRGLAVRTSHIKELALSRGLEIFQPPKIRVAEAVARITALQPDLLVVMAYGQILPQLLLDVPRLGALNLHASLLPRHRGAAPVHAAILSGDSASGITCMWMDAGLDTGDMLLQREIAIAPEETAGSLHDRLAELAPVVLAESLSLIREGRAPRTKQNEGQATYAPKLDRNFGRIGWSASAADIAQLVRAMHPWPGCSADLVMEDGKTIPLKLHRAAAAPGSSAPGSIADCLRVGCAGGGLLEILEVQAPGGRAMSAHEFLRGHTVSHFVAASNQQQQQAQQ
ncbi:MAG: methionyl-tRNA formyltransferase [Chthoniobacterales bacterium]